MRELIKAKRITKALEESDFQPHTDKSGSKHLANAQAILYNYFSSLITYPMWVHSDVSTDISCFICSEDSPINLFRTSAMWRSSCS